MGLLGWLFAVSFSQREITKKALKSSNKTPKRGTDQQNLSTKGFQKLPSSEEQPQPGGSCVGCTALPLGKNLHFPGLNCSPCWKLRTTGVILASSLSSTEIMEEPFGDICLIAIRMPNSFKDLLLLQELLENFYNGSNRRNEATLMLYSNNKIEKYKCC